MDPWHLPHAFRYAGIHCGIRPDPARLDLALIVSDHAHVIFPYHIAEEAVLEDSRGVNAIGTTRRGIGTCYRDKAGRSHAIRVGDLYHTETFRSRLTEIVGQKNTLLKALSPAYQPLDVTPEQAFRANEMRLNRDPFDALICAAAQTLGLPLITRDTEIHESGVVRVLW